MNRTILAVLVAAAAAPAFAQEVPGDEGPSGGPALGDGPREIVTTTAFAAKSPIAASRSVELPPLDAAPLLAQDAARAALPGPKSDPRVGVIRRFREIRAPRRLVLGAGGVTSMPEGSLVWIADVSAPGAVGLRLRVSRCDLPPQASLVVYDADEPSEAYGPYAGRGPDGDGEFLLPTVFGARARVEIRVPPESAGAPLRFSIDRVAQRYRERGEGLDDPRVGSAAKPDSCNNNVACDSSYTQDIARAVATMEITTSSGVFLCTGALLNDSEAQTSVPYFLTAHHCLSKESEANDTEFFFDYRAAECDGFPPPLGSVPRVAGSTVLESSAATDFTLLRLTGTMPSNRFLCGWTAARQTPGESIVGVHHPGGTHMRISYGTLIGPDGSFHQVQWSSGVTAGGSSGSPLFNSAKQVIGQLYGGISSCAILDGLDEYGRFDRTYASVSRYLGLGASGSTGDSFDPADDTVAGATLLLPGLFGAEHGPHLLSTTDTTDWFAFDLGAGARYRFFSTGQDDVRATLHSDALGVVTAASDDDAAGSLQFSIDFTAPAAGRYRLRVTAKTQGSGAEYSLQYAQVDLLRTTAPPSVAKLRKSVASGAVTLKWRDKARDEAGYYVELSADGGANWSRVAELPRDTRTFTHDPGPGLHRYRVGAWNAATDVKFREIAADVFDVNQLDPFDPADDSGAGATTLSPAAGGTTSPRTLSRADVEDWFTIDLAAGVTYTFETTGRFDTYGEIFDAANGSARVAFNDDSGRGTNFRVAFTATRPGAHWLRVRTYTEGDIAGYALAWREE